MKYWEAFDIARKTGKRVQTQHGTHAKWHGTKMVFCIAHSEVPLRDWVMDAEWSVVEEPQKEYDFPEAYAMMKKGAWMRPVDHNVAYTCHGRHWTCRCVNNIDRVSEEPFIGWRHLDAKWVESQP